MFEGFYKEKLFATGFYEPVEKNGMSLGDSYFKRIDIDTLEQMSNYQNETDPASYKAKWEKKIGEKLYIYNTRGFFSGDVSPVYLGDFSHYTKDYDDLRIADKDTLTRNAARKAAMCIYHGKGQIADAGVDGAIAMMLYIRNGYDKVDFWNHFEKEFMTGLEELLSGKESLVIDDLILKNPFKDERYTIIDLMKEVEESSKHIDDENFVVMDSEIAKIIKDTCKFNQYSDETVNEAIGQYVFIISHMFGFIMTKDMMLNHRNESDTFFFYGVDTGAFAAASTIRDFLLCHNYNLNDTGAYLGRCLAIYRKNGLSAADFWRNTCKYLVENNKKGY